MHKKQKSPFELLRNKAILAILDGDSQFGEIDDVEISMPYLSGLTIVEISNYLDCLKHTDGMEEH